MAESIDANILVVDDDPDVLTAARLLLRRRFSRVVTANDPGLIARASADGAPFDVLLIDLNYQPGENSGDGGLAWLSQLKAADPRVAVICMTAFGAVDLAVEAMRRGAADFVLKPWDNDKLAEAVAKAAGRRRAEASAAFEAPRPTEIAAASLTTSSPAFARTLARAARAAATPMHVLLRGEHGSGRLTIAREIHRLAGGGVFAALDLTVLPSAFPSADTIYVREITDAALDTQKGLFLLLRDGGQSVRVISSSSRDAAWLADPKRVHLDLSRQLFQLDIAVPPLRARAEDIGQLSMRFAADAARGLGRAPPQLTGDALDALEAYDWPGNIAELRLLIERAVIFAEGDAITAEDLAIPDANAAPLQDRSLAARERQAVQTALNRWNGNISRAAHDLGLSRAALYRRIEKYGL